VTPTSQHLPHLLYQPKETSPGQKPRRHQRRKEETAKRKEQARERKTYVTLPEEFLLLSFFRDTHSLTQDLTRRKSLCEEGWT